MGGWPIWVLAAKILLKLHEEVNTHVSSLLGYPRTMAAYSLNWDNQTFLKYGISHLAYYGVYTTQNILIAICVF